MSGKAASISRRTALQSFLCILSGACWGLALVFAGTSDAKVKALLMIPKASAGTDIYYRIKNELLDLFGSKPEDAYDRACFGS